MEVVIDVVTNHPHSRAWRYVARGDHKTLCTIKVSSFYLFCVPLLPVLLLHTK